MSAGALRAWHAMYGWGPCPKTASFRWAKTSMKTQVAVKGRSQSLKLGPIVRTIRIFTRNCALIALDIVQQ